MITFLQTQSFTDYIGIEYCLLNKNRAFTEAFNETAHQLPQLEQGFLWKCWRELKTVIKKGTRQ